MSRRLLVGYLAVVVLALAVLEVPLGISYGRNERHNLETKVERDAVVIASIAEGPLEKGASVPAAVMALAAGYQRDTGGRVVVVDRRGTSLVDTAPRAGESRSFRNRPEIAAALSGTVASGVRYSATLRRSLLYVAVPIASGGVVHGAVRITYPTSTVDSRIRRYWLALAAIAGVVLAIAAVAGVALARWIARPLAKLERSAGEAGAGDLTVRADDAEGPPEVRSLASTFNDMVGRLAALVESQQAFVADASHQLRTPLTALRLRLENLARDVVPAGRQELEGALDEVERLGGLVEGLLELARADAGVGEAGTVEVAAALEERRAAWAQLAVERGVRLVVHAEPSTNARATPERLAQVFDNLISNALEVSPPGGTVTLTVRRVRDRVEIHVADEGPGLSEEDRRRAADRFWRGREGRGSGLGLAIAKRLVAADGGELELAVAAGGGLDAIVRLRVPD